MLPEDFVGCLGSEKEAIEQGQLCATGVRTDSRTNGARLKWSVTPNCSDANHEPVVRIEGPRSVLASAGDKIRLNGSVTDPDGDSVSVKWCQFQVGSYPGKVTISNSASERTGILIPGDAKAGQTIHIILEATDTGTPSVTRYQRVIITIRE
jgi:hypothetical protein